MLGAQNGKNTCCITKQKKKNKKKQNKTKKTKITYTLCKQRYQRRFWRKR